MNNNKLWWIIGAIIVIALAAYVLMNREDETMVESETGTEQSSEVMMQEPRSLRELMASSAPVKCEFFDAEAESQGTVYVANKKVRGDFEMKVNEETTTAHMIMDDLTIYSWMDGEIKGFKMTVSDEEMVEGEAEARSKTLDPDKKVDYECGAWSGDSAMFTPPAEIEFTDYSSMMPSTMMQTEGGASGSTDMKALQCAACDSAPEASRASCKAALGCN